VASLESLAGLPCTSSGVPGTTRITVADGNVAIFCDVPRPVGPVVRPVFSTLSVSGSIAVVTFSEPVCRGSFFAPFDWSGTINGFNTPAVADSIPMCDSPGVGVLTANVLFPNAAPFGAFVTLTANTAGFQSSVLDIEGNALIAPQTRTATATAPETIKPRIVSATSAVGTATVTLTFSEPVYCLPFFPLDVFAIHDDDPGADLVITGMGSDVCSTALTTADTSFSLTTLSAFRPGLSYTFVVINFLPQIRDLAGNILLAAEVPIAVAPFVP
jgi:hypothetical protein